MLLAINNLLRGEKMEDNRDVLLREGKIQPLLLKMALPAIVSMMIGALYNTVDSIFMGMLGTNALGAASIGFPYILITGALSAGFGIGGGSYQSRLLGSKKKKEAESLLTTNLVTVFLIGVVISIIAVIFTPKLVVLFGASGVIVEDSITYVRILASGTSFFVLIAVFTNHMRAEGSATIALITNGSGAILNIILDPILMFGLNIGVAGAAIATVISQVISVIIGFSYYKRGKTLLKIDLSLFKPEKEMYKNVLKTGVPTMIQQVMVAVISILYIREGAKFGEHVVASVGAYFKLYYLGLAVVIGFGLGLLPVLAYNYGAKLHSRVKDALKFSYGLTIAYCILAMVIFLSFSNQIASLFSSDLKVIETLNDGVRGLGYSWIFFGLYFISLILFQALGHGKEAIRMTIFREAVYPIIILYASSFLWGSMGLMYSLSVVGVLSAITAGVLVIPLYKSLHLSDEVNQFNEQMNIQN